MSLRQRFIDWWTDTLVCYGGPLDGQRIPSVRQEMDRHTGMLWTPWKYYGWSRHGFLVDDLWACPDMEGMYTMRGHRYEWEQHSRNTLSVQPNGDTK